MCNIVCMLILMIYVHIHLSSYLSIYLFIYLFTYLSVVHLSYVCVSIYPSICLSIHLSVCLFIYLPVYPSICLSISQFTWVILNTKSVRILAFFTISVSLFDCPSIHLPHCLSVCLFIYLSVYLTVYLDYFEYQISENSGVLYNISLWSVIRFRVGGHVSHIKLDSGYAAIQLEQDEISFPGN